MAEYLTFDSKCMQLQEQQESGVEIPIFEHTIGECFIINTHALCNAHLSHEALPHDLTNPVPYVQNQSETHEELAASIQSTQGRKREDLKKKAATNASKKANAELLVQQDGISEVEEVGSDQEGAEDATGREDGVGDGIVMSHIVAASGTVSRPTNCCKM